MRLPVFTSLRGYQAGWLRADAVAGLTVWAVLVPGGTVQAAVDSIGLQAGTRPEED